MYKIVKRFYDRGIYSTDDVSKFVLSGSLTSAEYKDITGTGYSSTDDTSTTDTTDTTDSSTAAV
ncbi:MAG: XkdX family protein [Clostridia bacterium]|jgi:uncharacterized XkdX family phage protein|nr:XkdX family protein [Clostridia bacterium]